MRRKDREIVDRLEIDAIIHSATVMHLAMSDNDVPFLVPLFYAYDGQAIFFHSAHAGTKMEILKRNNKVCFEISVDHGVIESEQACDFEARHRTVIGFGSASFIEDEAEKTSALDLIVARFSDKKFDYPKAAVNRTAVIKIEIESIKGKRHGF
ncbi:putative nitroimidazole resistance protein [Chloroherpeton thalassium ATCC 35110]|uniref:Putative nitroimidazole resistance protein n=2 Tax=Chloroherpeton thalassium TaxID=100716 RepID=B3QTU3_CHLT3|nr:putative nitroimidazole resistance protein [Chloroherpeton thalassium ATCC 35110]